MVVHTLTKNLLSHRAQKRFGHPNQYGQNAFGLSWFGIKNDHTGIYQVRHTKKRTQSIVIQFYDYKITHTIPQQANREFFATAVSAWQALTAEQKEFYKQKAMGSRRTGYNVFLHEFLIPH